VNILVVNLSIDGEIIELNEFVAKFFASTLEGAVSALRDINSNWKELSITVKR
jgi:hypothetical protein